MRSGQTKEFVMHPSLWAIGTIIIVGILTAAVVRRSRRHASLEDDIRERLAEAGPAIKKKTGWWK
jgi:hypothetical protein